MSGGLRSKIYDQHLQLSCSHYLPVDSTQIPTGALLTAKNSPFDFSTERKLVDSVLSIEEAGAVGLDHCYVVDGALSDNDSKEALEYLYDASEQLSGISNYLRHVATLSDPVSGRQLVLHATQPGVQIYTANWLAQRLDMHPHTQHNAICLETQHFPDAINQASFPSIVQRSEDGPYHHSAVFSFRIK
jgi:aldose 1-epimerase